MSEEESPFLWLERWYLSNCDGDWEHSYGIDIGTLDNPGWSVKIDIEETDVEDKFFRDIDDERKEDNWIECKKCDGQFLGFGGPHNLREIIEIFRDWVES